MILVSVTRPPRTVIAELPAGIPRSVASGSHGLSSSSSARQKVNLPG
jgi:hypothetical protein